MLFYYIKRRFPTALEQSTLSNICFDELENVSDEFSDLLNDFFHKTLSSYTKARYSTDNELVDALNRLYNNSEVKQPMFESNFVPPSVYFIGRNHEISEMHSALECIGKVVISGAGGTGKSSLALNYASFYREEYDTVIVIKYIDSVDRMIEDIPVKNYEGKKKAEMIKNLCNEKILLIIDNFDDMNTELLEQYFGNLSCRIIVTTRMNFEFSNAEKIKLDGLNEAEELFYHYCRRNFDFEAKKVISRLIYHLNNHVMTIELLAKLLRNADIKLLDVYDRFVCVNKDEVKNEKLRQFKDSVPRNTDINRHIDILYDLFGFSKDEQTVMQVISLVSEASLRKDLLFGLCDFIEPKTVNELIFKGWIDEIAELNLIAVHPLIMERTIYHLKPERNITAEIFKTLKHALEKSIMKSSKERKYILSISENAVSKIDDNFDELAELKTTIGLIYLRGKISVSSKYFLSIEKGQRTKEYDLYESVYELNRHIGGEKSSEYMKNLSLVLKKYIGSHEDYIKYLYVAEIAESICRNFLYDDIPEKSLLWDNLLEVLDYVYKNASSDIKKYASDKLYTLYSDIMIPVHSESKALKYKDDSYHAVTIIYKGKTLEKTEQEKISDQIEAMCEDGNIRGAFLLALKTYLKYRVTGKPFEPYLSVQLVNLMVGMKRYSEAIHILELEKNEYNCLMIARLYIKCNKKYKTPSYLNRAEKYWIERINIFDDEKFFPASLISVYLLKWYYLSDAEAKGKADEYCNKAIHSEIRISSDELAADCIVIAEKFNCLEREKYLYYYAAFADVLNMTEKKFEKYCELRDKVEIPSIHKLVYTAFEAEYAANNGELKQAEELYENAVDLCGKTYGNEDYRTAKLLCSLADVLCNNSEILKRVNYQAIAEKEIKKEKNFSRRIDILLEYAGKYKAIGNTSCAECLLDEALNELNRIDSDTNERCVGMQSVMMYYSMAEDYLKAINIGERAYILADEKCKVELCSKISQYYAEMKSIEKQTEWLEKQISILEDIEKQSNVMNNKLLKALSVIENLYLENGDYIKASYYRNKYNSIIQNIII